MKHNKYTPMIIVIMALISFLCLSLGVSYSYVMRSSVNANAVIITTGNLTSTVEYGAVEMLLSPMNDEEGMAQELYGEISISKDNVYSVFYKMNISYATDALPNGITLSNLLPMEYIRVALFEINGNKVSDTPVVGPVALGDLTISEIGSTASPYYASYLLNYGTFLSGTQNAKYALKVWLDEKTPKIEDSVVYLNVSVDQDTLVSKSLYNISGKVIDGSGYALSGVVVSFHNNKITATTASDGTYTLTNVPTGTYTLEVQFGGESYKTTIHIKSGGSISLQSVSGSTGALGSYIQNSAYSYYTTPGLIKSFNSLTTNSNQSTVTSYTIPTSYVLTGIDSLSILDINNLTLTLNADNTLGLSRAS